MMRPVASTTLNILDILNRLRAESIDIVHLFYPEHTTTSETNFFGDFAYYINVGSTPVYTSDQLGEQDVPRALFTGQMLLSSRMDEMFGGFIHETGHGFEHVLINSWIPYLFDSDQFGGDPVYDVLFPTFRDTEAPLQPDSLSAVATGSHSVRLSAG